ncbi:competence protein ComGB [Enterococcus sp. AZ194]|uniref:competence type IV pilus assembly protein ComGB n=1 Tax=Enterococcus sp. AZ194 TaxID=2774629 RepID=UPI003F2287A8
MRKTTSWKKNKRSQQQLFLLFFSELLQNGFSIQEALKFIKKMNQFPETLLTQFQTGLVEGQSLADCFMMAEFSPQQIVQIQLAQVHGNFVSTLRSMAQQMNLLETQRKNFIKLCSYPVLLLLFMAGVLIGMRQVLLPQLLMSGMVNKGHLGIQFIDKGPIYIGAFCGIVSLFIAGFRLVMSRRTALQRAMVYSRIFGVGAFYRSYLSAYISLEWGKLFQEGLEMRQIIDCLILTRKGSIMQEVAEDLKTALQIGRPLAEQLEGYLFLTTEMSRIVIQGEAKGRLGEELLFYSDFMWKEFFKKIERALQWIQPIIFLLIAVLIVSVYAAMLLPIYGNMEGVL